MEICGSYQRVNKLQQKGIFEMVFAIVQWQTQVQLN